ncbi:putative Yip interacting protein [Giardia muris]|uniref:Putative Yip interacting protein n=1 Tax=Giardia muris TaxID=5742 RepID=A0A4Z1T695_GIAMU|nr:putative Yip interacting protein [Giardia muris]|eukprot:TNJ28657.1 putative Yip interacting protein [Giardia muris]
MYVGSVKSPVISVIRAVVCYLVPVRRLAMVLSGTVYPMPANPHTDYHTQQILLRDEQVDELVQQLPYWIVLGLALILEGLVDPILCIIPFYELIKLFFYIWLTLGNGTAYLFKRVSVVAGTIGSPSKTTAKDMVNKVKDRLKEIMATPSTKPDDK